jgi:hypothetical protein
MSAAFSPDGRRVVTASGNTARVSGSVGEAGSGVETVAMGIPEACNDQTRMQGSSMFV